MKILIIDDDKAFCRSLKLQLEDAGEKIEFKNNANDGITEVEKNDYDLVFLDLTLPDIDGIHALKKIHSIDNKLPVIVISGKQDMSSLISAIKEGASDFIRKPVDIDDILISLEKYKRVIPSRKEKKNIENNGDTLRGEIIGDDPKILEILKKIGILSRSRVCVLILGESGTGKELIARALHNFANPKKPFVAINCSAIVPTLLESEIFGHEKGAFTGAEIQKKGKLEIAGDGTIFFDEIGDLSMELQSKLLRVLQEREFERVGGNSTIKFAARPIFATHKDLSELVRSGNFREDLYYRINVVSIEIPPLRERNDDIPKLTSFLIGKISNNLEKQIDGITDDALLKLKKHSWPGNIRELENILIRAISMTQSNLITKDDVVFDKISPQEQGSLFKTVVPLSKMEAEYIKFALNRLSWNITKTAKTLEISPTTLRKKINDYNISK